RNPVRLLLGQRRPKAIQARLLAILRHVQHAASCQVVDQRQVLVPLAERFLVHPQITDHFRLSSRQSPPYGTFHDPMHLVPRQAQLIRHRLLTGRLQPVDRQAFKQRREPAMRFGPGQTHNAYPMFGTTAARGLGVQDGTVLARVQMPPMPFAVVVVQRALRTALWARPRYLRIMPQMHMDFPFLQFQFHPLYAPRSRDSQNLLIQLRVLHGVSSNSERHHANRLTPFRQSSKITLARRNGVGHCWEATRQGISESRMCQRHRCPGSLTLSGHSRFIPPIPLDIRAMPHKIPGAKPQLNLKFHTPKTRNSLKFYLSWRQERL